MRTTALFVDFTGIDEALRLASLPVNPALLAQSLRKCAKLLTGDVVSFACGTWLGAEQAAAEAFRREGYTILPATGDPETKRQCFEAQLAELQQAATPPRFYVFVTHDTALAPLACRLAEGGTDMRVWGLACSAPEALRDNPLEFYSLEELLDLRVRSRALFIDFENVAFCLHEMGYAVDPWMLARTLREQAAQGGKVQAFAYADWHRLPPMQDATGRSLSSEAQRIFELSNIETRYLISRAGKNTADMKIADDIRTVLQEPNSPDTYIIASGDRDFNPVIETLLRNGKEVIVWGVRGKTSRTLSETTHVEYLQEFLPLVARAARPAAPAGECGEAPAVPSRASESVPSLWTPLVMMLDDLMTRNSWSWISFSKLVTEASQSGKFGTGEEEARDLINQAIAQEIILRERIANPNPNYPDQFIWACRPNEESQPVQASRLVPPIVLDFVWRGIVERGWDYVAFSFVLKEMSTCAELNRPGFNTDDDWRAAWINFLVSEGKLRLERRPHPKNRRDLMKALILPEQDVLMRIVISVDNFCDSRSTTWEAASALLQYLACFGVDAVRLALAAGEKYGAFHLAKYTHPADPERPATTGVTLNTEVPFVARVLERRNSLLRALYSIQERSGAVWEKDIAAVAGDKASLWRSILSHERLLRPAEPAGDGHRYILSRSHPVVRAACGLAEEEGDGVNPNGNGNGHGDSLQSLLFTPDEVVRPARRFDPVPDLPAVGPSVFD